MRDQLGVFEPDFLLVVDEDLELVHRALAKTPSDRYADLQQMRVEVTRVRQALEASALGDLDATIAVLPIADSGTVARAVRRGEADGGALAQPTRERAVALGARLRLRDQIRLVVVLRRARTVDLRNRDGRGAAAPTIAEVDAAALNGPPVTGQWIDDRDLREQRERQSAARRYE